MTGTARRVFQEYSLACFLHKVLDLFDIVKLLKAMLIMLTGLILAFSHASEGFGASIPKVVSFDSGDNAL